MRITNRLFMLRMGRDVFRDLPASFGFALLPKQSEPDEYGTVWTFFWSFYIAWEWLPHVMWRGYGSCGRGH